MKKICYSTPLSICLAGEYGALYQKPMLTVAVEPRITFCVWETKGKKGMSKKYQDISEIALDYLRRQNIRYVEKWYDCSFDGIPMITESFDEINFIMAQTVVVVAGFLKFYSGKKLNKEVVNSLAFEVEKKRFRNAFGAIGSTSSFGGMIYYRKEFEFLKYISRLSFRIPQRIEQSLFLIGVVGEKTSLEERLKLVKDRFGKDPEKIEQILINQEKITRRMVISLMKEDEVLFSDCVVGSEHLQESLGVVSKETISLLKKLTPYGVGKSVGSNLVLFCSSRSWELERFLVDRNIVFMKFKQDFTGL